MSMETADRHRPAGPDRGAEGAAGRAGPPGLPDRPGPHLFRAAAGPVPQGGLMALDCVGFDGRGRPPPV